MPAKRMSVSKHGARGNRSRKVANPSSTLPFDHLRAMLAALQPTGDHGFEGLVAAAASQLSGVPFRLVGSGRQFGRDAEGVPGSAAVMMEAKRYATKLRFEALSAKLTEALDRSRRDVEVWCAAATVAFDAADAGDLKAMGEARGTTVLILDWAQPLPPLAVVLAAAREAAVGWFAQNATAAAAATVGEELASVSSHPMYREHADAIRAEFRGPSLGLPSARRGNAAWMARHFGDASLALHRFNQALAPLDPKVRPAPVRRARLEERIRQAMAAWDPEPCAIVLTGAPGRGEGGRGDEGVGKSWAAVRSWLEMQDEPDRPRPILLLMTSNMWRDGDEQAPMDLLARLAAEQTGPGPVTDLARWRARLDRWLAVPEGAVGRAPAVVVVLDGVNERTHHPWPVLIAKLLLEARTRMLRVIVTTRRGIYERDLIPRLTRSEVREIPVEAFSDEELDHLLALEGRKPETVREPLRGFLRNPRVLSVGLPLLDRLDPDEVGIERLLFEYMRKRQEERARGGGHTADGLARVLVNHAREIRERLLGQVGARQAEQFEDRTIHERLGLPAGQANLALDLGEIIDSGFIEIVDRRRGRYALREHGRALGLGLLVIDELDEAVRDGSTDLEGVLAAIVEPIRAIDETALVLVGALDIAIADPEVDDAVAAALLHQVLTLQNLPAGQRARVFSGLSERPDVFVHVADRLFGEEGRVGRREWMRDELVAARARPGAAAAIDRAVRRWLRSWQPQPRPPMLDAYPEDQARDARRRHEEAARAHLRDLDDFTAAERAYVDRELVPLPPGYVHRVDEAAIAILAGRPLHEYADELFAWCVAAAAGWESGASREAMHWLRTLAPVDWEEAAEAVGERAKVFLTPDRSPAFRLAIDYALSGSGDPEQARLAAEARAGLGGDGRDASRAAGLRDRPDVDPRDPETTEPTGEMDEAARRYDEWTKSRPDGAPLALMRDYNPAVSHTRLVLCRFRPEAAAGSHRDLAERCGMIDGAASARLAQFVLHDTAILAPAVEPVVAWMEKLRTTPDPEPDEEGLPNVLLAAVLPHLSAERQFELHSGQRAVRDDALWLGTLFKPLPERSVAERLHAAAASGDPEALRLALVATADAGSDASAVREHALAALADPNARLRAAAHRAMTRVGVEADRGAFASSWSRPRPIADEALLREDFWGSLRFIRALAEADDPALPDRVTPALRNLVLERGGPRMLEAALDGVARVLRETDPHGLVPPGLQIDVVRSDDLPEAGDPMGSWQRIGFETLDEWFEAADGTRRRIPDMTDFFAFACRLEAEGREILLHPLSSAVLDRAAILAPDAFDRLTRVVEKIAGSDNAAVAAVLACDVARIMASRDPLRAARLFTAYDEVTPLLPEVMPTSLLPRAALLLWRSADHPEIAAVRERRLDAASDDLRLAREVLAAEMAGRHRSIVRYVEERLSRRRPVDLARAVTAAGFATDDPALDRVFADERFRHGFLRDAARRARRGYDLARWADRWHRAAVAAGDGVDAWRHTELAIACADGRCVLWAAERPGRQYNGSHWAVLPHRYAAAVRAADKNRRGTLFGLRVPPAWVTIC